MTYHKLLNQRNMLKNEYPKIYRKAPTQVQAHLRFAQSPPADQKPQISLPLAPFYINRKSTHTNEKPPRTKIKSPRKYLTYKDLDKTKTVANIAYTQWLVYCTLQGFSPA